MGQPDKRPVRPAHHRPGASMSPESGYRVDEQLNLVGQQRVDPREFLAGKLAAAGWAVQGDVGSELVLVPVIDVAHGLGATLILLQYPLANDLLDVAWHEIDGERETIPDSSELHPLVPQRTNHVLKGLLAGRDQPQAPVLLLEGLGK